MEDIIKIHDIIVQALPILSDTNDTTVELPHEPVLHLSPIYRPMNNELICTNS